MDALGRMFDADSIKTAIQNWRHPGDLTLIDGGDIYTDTIHTGQIHFDPYTERPTLREGLLYWYKGEGKEQLEFAPDADPLHLAIIPKFPLFDIQAPPENFVPNQSFEIDRDGDGIPDFWEFIREAGVPTKGVTTNYPWSGRYSFYIHSATTTDKSYLRSVWIPVQEGKKYYFAVDVYNDSGATRTFGYYVAVVEFWNAGRTAKTNTINLGSTLANGWNHLSNSATAAVNSRWARVYLYNYLPDAICTNYFDNVVFSEMRAAIPTAGVIAASSATYGNETSVPDLTWTTLFDWTVASAEMESYFISAAIQVRSSPGADFWLRVRIYDSTDGIYYPINDVGNTHQVPMIFPNLTYSAGTALFTIPKSVAGHHIYLQVLHSLGASKLFMARYAGWGHSPHTHR